MKTTKLYASKASRMAKSTRPTFAKPTRPIAPCSSRHMPTPKLMRCSTDCGSSSGEGSGAQKNDFSDRRHAAEPAMKHDGAGALVDRHGRGERHGRGRRPIGHDIV